MTPQEQEGFIPEYERDCDPDDFSDEALCHYCGGEGSVDTGGQEPSGRFISASCPECNGTGLMTIAQAALVIFDRWDEWEAEAGQLSQVEQSPGAGNALRRSRLEAVLHDLVEVAAKTCERRANCRQENIPIYNEAMKCAEQIRHNLRLPIAARKFAEKQGEPTSEKLAALSDATFAAGMELLDGLRDSQQAPTPPVADVELPTGPGVWRRDAQWWLIALSCDGRISCGREIFTDGSLGPAILPSDLPRYGWRLANADSYGGILKTILTWQRVEQLETERDDLQAEVATLRTHCSQLEKQLDSAQRAANANAQVTVRERKEHEQQLAAARDELIKRNELLRECTSLSSMTEWNSLMKAWTPTVLSERIKAALKSTE